MAAPSALQRFYDGSGRDAAGRTLDEILAWDDATLEAVHDYIQWLFPLPERSAFNAQAPLLTRADIAAFRASDALQARLATAWERMRRFYGLTDDASGPRHWLTPGNHNFLRLSRVLRCLTLLGLAAEAAALLGRLEQLHAENSQVIGARTLDFWRGAVR